MARNFSEAERLTILGQYLQSKKSMSSFAKATGISHTILRVWLRRYDVHSPSIQMQMDSIMKKIPNDVASLQEELSRLRREKRELEKELEKERFRLQASEMLIDLAESTYHIKVRKNSAAK